MTSKPAVYAQRIGEHFDLSKYCAAICGPALDDLDGNKVRLVHRVLETERLDPTTVAAIGDRTEDIAGARENGVRSLGATWGYGSREELEGADHIVNSPSELVSWLGSEIQR